MNSPIVQPFADVERAAAPGQFPAIPEAPRPDAVWPLPGGTAWVFYGDGHDGLVQPVILSDGFSMGPSNVNELYAGLNLGDYAFINELRRRGGDFILVGYDERSARIQDNAQAVIYALFRAIAERQGDAPLTVGGFSMGGLVTRYALAKLEQDGMDHQAALYVSYDSPHRGAWIPVSLQGLAHFLKSSDPGLSTMINSPAARQLLWRHLPSLSLPITIREDPLRTDFLAELASLGSWPQRPRLIGVANGSGTGETNGMPPGAIALEVTGGALNTTKLYLQDSGTDQLVAYLKVLLPLQVKTPGFPRLDSAAGGTLDSFGIAASALTEAGQATESEYPTVDFVPAVSAVAIRDIDTQENLDTDISALPPGESELDEFLCATSNEAHTRMTERLGSWILDRMPLK